MKKSLMLAVAVAFASPVFAREPVPIVDFTDQAIVTASGKAPSSEQVRKAILLGAAEAGWSVTPGEGEHIVASLVVRGKHTAITDVTWSPDAFSVTYRDSINLKYRSGRIHPNYNVWVRKLVESIRSQLLAM